MRCLGHQDLLQTDNSDSTSCDLIFCHRRQRTIEFIGCCLSKHLEPFTMFCIKGRKKKISLWRSVKKKSTSLYLHKGASISLQVKTYFLDSKFQQEYKDKLI